MPPLILFRPLVPLCWVVISYPRNFAAPVRACVIRVFPADSSRWSSSRRKVVSRCLISSASAFGPVNPKSVSSAYAEDRVMPTLVSDALVRAVGGFLVSA
jgi:hypothetical protein